MRILFLTEFFPDFEKRTFTGGVEARTFYTALFWEGGELCKILYAHTQEVPELFEIESFGFKYLHIMLKGYAALYGISYCKDILTGKAKKKLMK